jgi:hypothetical protein
MFQAHNPAQHTFNWYCDLIGATENNTATAAVRLRSIVKQIRDGYRHPFGIKFPYGDQSFQNGYLIAYFPYYIEPLYHVLNSANLPDNLFAKENLKVSFFGGGPCPEALGLAAYLRERAPNLRSVDISIFDRENSWDTIQQGLLPEMLPDYAAPQTKFSIKNHQCNVVRCSGNKCASSNAITGSDIVIAQNFLTEVHKNGGTAIDTFEGIIRRSNCRFLVFVENNYPENRDMLNVINRRLFSKGLSTDLAAISQKSIRPNITLPGVLSRHLYTEEDGLRAKKNVTFYYVVIELKRGYKL